MIWPSLAYIVGQARNMKEALDNQQNAEAQRERYYATIHKVALQSSTDKIPGTNLSKIIMNSDLSLKIIYHHYCYINFKEEPII